MNKKQELKENTGAKTPKKHLPEALEKNLWKPGESGNPNGRPKGSVSVVDAIKRKLCDVNPENKKTYLDTLIEKLFKKAIDDEDVTMIKDIINRIDGLPQGSTGDTNVNVVIPIMSGTSVKHIEQ